MAYSYSDFEIKKIEHDYFIANLTHKEIANKYDLKYYRVIEIINFLFKERNKKI